MVYNDSYIKPQTGEGVLILLVSYHTYNIATVPFMDSIYPGCTSLGLQVPSRTGVEY